MNIAKNMVETFFLLGVGGGGIYEPSDHCTCGIFIDFFS